METLLKNDVFLHCGQRMITVSTIQKLKYNLAGGRERNSPARKNDDTQERAEGRRGESSNPFRVHHSGGATRMISS